MLYEFQLLNNRILNYCTFVQLLFQHLQFLNSNLLEPLYPRVQDCSLDVPYSFSYNWEKSMHCFESYYDRGLYFLHLNDCNYPIFRK